MAYGYWGNRIQNITQKLFEAAEENYREKLHGDKMGRALSLKLVNPLSWLTHLTSTVYIKQSQPIHIFIFYK